MRCDVYEREGLYDGRKQREHAWNGVWDAFNCWEEVLPSFQLGFTVYRLS